MTPTIAIALQLLIPVLIAQASAEVERPADHLLGIRLGMSQPEVTKILSTMGHPNPTLRGIKEGWELTDARWGHLVVRYDEDLRVRWVTLLSRPESTPIRFSDVGDVIQAERRGYYTFTWRQPPEGDRPGYTVTARGTDPEFLSSLSLSPYVPPRRDTGSDGAGG